LASSSLRLPARTKLAIGMFMRRVPSGHFYGLAGAALARCGPDIDGRRDTSIALFTGAAKAEAGRRARCRTGGA
jgi:hypothetical protein